MQMILLSFTKWFGRELETVNGPVRPIISDNMEMTRPTADRSFMSRLKRFWRGKEAYGDFARRRETRVDSRDSDDDSTRHRPSSLLDHINAATRNTILGTTSPFNFVGSDTPSGAGGPDDNLSSRPAHARYSFDGTGEGELPIAAGVEVDVLDDRDSACVCQKFCCRRYSYVFLVDGGMREMSEQAVKDSSRRRTCIRFP